MDSFMLKSLWFSKEILILWKEWVIWTDKRHIEFWV